jgi:hypothetical protein
MTTAVPPPTPQAQILAYQLGNIYGLMCILGISILSITSDPRIVKAYIVCLAIADIGHIGMKHSAPLIARH